MGVEQKGLQNLPLSVSHSPGVYLNGSGRGVRGRLLIANSVPLGGVLVERTRWSSLEALGVP